MELGTELRDVADASSEAISLFHGNADDTEPLFAPSTGRSHSPREEGAGGKHERVRQTRDIAAIARELAQIREEEARRTREAEEVRESIALLQRIHLRETIENSDEEV